MKVKEFFKKFAMGALIGAAMIIPGVSGGTIAVLLKIYDKLIGALSDLRKDFKNSFFFLLPIVLGAVAGVAALYFPLKYAIAYAPMPTILLFAGLMVGSFPKLFKDTAKNGFKPYDAVAIVVPLAFVLGICFIPSLGQANLGADMPVWGYFVLILIGAVASCALVVPGVSGSLLLLVFGYYEPILNTVSALLTSFGHSLLVLALFAAGLIIGFFSIAKLMKFLLKRFPRVTGWAILGFVFGSIPALCFTEEFLTAPVDGVQIAMGVLLCAAGAIAAFALTAYAEAKMKKSALGAKPSVSAEVPASANPAQTEGNTSSTNKNDN